MSRVHFEIQNGNIANKEIVQKKMVEHFVQSQRDDRQSNKPKLPRAEKPQGEIVSHIMYINAQELMFMARRRLCMQASPETRQVMKMIVEQVLETNPEFKNVLVPMCEYQGRCPEFNPCGKQKLHRVK